MRLLRFILQRKKQINSYNLLLNKYLFTEFGINQLNWHNLIII